MRRLSIDYCMRVSRHRVLGPMLAVRGDRMVDRSIFFLKNAKNLGFVSLLVCFSEITFFQPTSGRSQRGSSIGQHHCLNLFNIMFNTLYQYIVYYPKFMIFYFKTMSGRPTSIDSSTFGILCARTTRMQQSIESRLTENIRIKQYL